MRDWHGVHVCTDYYDFHTDDSFCYVLTSCHILASTFVLTHAVFILCRYSGDSRCIWGPGSGREHVDRCISYMCIYLAYFALLFIYVFITTFLRLMCILLGYGFVSTEVDVV